MRSHAEQAYPHECCGLLLGRSTQEHKTLAEIRAVDNAWNQDIAQELGEGSSFNRERRYWIDPQRILRVMQEARTQGLDIIGIYHSHPDHPAVPSECDRRLAWQHYSYIILSVQQGTVQDMQNWQLDRNHQFQPEAMTIHPSLHALSAPTSNV